MFAYVIYCIIETTTGLVRFLSWSFFYPASGFPGPITWNWSPRSRDAQHLRETPETWTVDCGPVTSVIKCQEWRRSSAQVTLLTAQGWISGVVLQQHIRVTRKKFETMFWNVNWENWTGWLDLKYIFIPVPRQFIYPWHPTGKYVILISYVPVLWESWRWWKWCNS